MRGLDGRPARNGVGNDNVRLTAERAQFFPLRINQKRGINFDTNAGIFQQVGDWSVFWRGDQRLPSIFLEPAPEVEQGKRRAARRHLV